MINKNKYFVYVVLISITSIAFSQSIQDLQKLKLEYEKYQKDIKKTKLPFDTTEPLEEGGGDPELAKVLPYDPTVDFEFKEEVTKHFGYDFFTKRDTVPFWESLPTPANYLLGPGDELIISLWGQTQLRETFTISREGKIYNDKVGLLSLSGKSLFDARKYLYNEYGRIYATLKGSSPTTFMDVSLGELKSINVNFVGQVKYPGIYPVHPFSTVITGLIQSGGIDTTGTLRNIQIIRNGENFLNIDLYDYFLKGSLPSNIQLRDQDIVLVPFRSSQVEVDSAVINPGIFEIVEGESLFDLINYAGGVTYNYSDKIGLVRINPIDKRKESSDLYTRQYIDLESSKLIPAINGDHITVGYLFDEIEMIEIIGQVKAPGVYHFYNGMSLNKLISLSGGFEDSTFWKSIYQDQAEIIRRDPSSRYEKVIKVNLGKVYSGDEDDIQLQNLDRVVIHANLNYFEKENVQITGEVNIPGSYPLVSDNETLKSVINRAGGLTPKALKNGISIFRDQKYFDVKTNDVKDELDEDELDEDKKPKVLDRRVRVAWSNDSIALMPGDSVIIKVSTGTVNLSGEVYNPGLVEFRKGKSLSYYINAAGGITEEGNKQSIFVVYANGSISPKKWYSSPKIQDGSTIVVSEKPFSEPFDFTQFATNWTSIVGSLLTAIVVSRQL